MIFCVGITLLSHIFHLRLGKLKSPRMIISSFSVLSLKDLSPLLWSIFSALLASKDLPHYRVPLKVYISMRATVVILDSPHLSCLERNCLLLIQYSVQNTSHVFSLTQFLKTLKKKREKGVHSLMFESFRGLSKLWKVFCFSVYFSIFWFVA